MKTTKTLPLFNAPHVYPIGSLPFLEEQAFKLFMAFLCRRKAKKKLCEDSQPKELTN